LDLGVKALGFLRFMLRFFRVRRYLDLGL